MSITGQPSKLQIIQGHPADPCLELELADNALWVHSLDDDHQQLCFSLAPQFSDTPAALACWQRISELLMAGLFANHDSAISWSELQHALFAEILTLNKKHPDVAACLLADYIRVLACVIPALEAPYLHLGPNTAILSDYHCH